MQCHDIKLPTRDGHELVQEPKFVMNFTLFVAHKLRFIPSCCHRPPTNLSDGFGRFVPFILADMLRGLEKAF